MNGQGNRSFCGLRCAALCIDLHRLTVEVDCGVDGKVRDFGNVFMFKAILCANPAVECQNLTVFCDLGVPEFVLTIFFATYGLSKPCSEVLRGGFRLVSNQSETRLMVLEGCQNGLKLIFFFKEGSETICFSIHGHSEPSSDGFREVSFFLRLPYGQYGPVSQLSRSEKRCTGPFNWGEAHCAGENVKRRTGPFQRKSLTNQTRTTTQQRDAARYGNQEPPGQAPRCTGRKKNNQSKQETSQTDPGTS